MKPLNPNEININMPLRKKVLENQLLLNPGEMHYKSLLEANFSKLIKNIYPEMRIEFKPGVISSWLDLIKFTFMSDPTLVLENFKYLNSMIILLTDNKEKEIRDKLQLQFKDSIIPESFFAILLTLSMIAEKLNDDEHYNNAAYAKIYLAMCCNQKSDAALQKQQPEGQILVDKILNETQIKIMLKATRVITNHKEHLRILNAYEAILLSAFEYLRLSPPIHSPKLR